MKIRILILAFFLVFLISCASKETDDYSQVLNDLQLLANAVDSFSFSPPTGNTSTSQNKSNLAPDLRTIDIDNTASFEYSDENESISINYEYYDIDGITPVTENDAFQQEGYVEKQESIYKNNKIESTLFIVTTAIKNENGFRERSMTGNGKIDYVNHSLVLIIDNIIMSLTENEGFSIRYEISFMDDKYNFVLFKNYTLEELMTPNSDKASDEVLTSSTIYDNNENAVGTFILNVDRTVIIKDRDGNIIQRAG